jgi:hypothetical protein
VVDEAEGSLYWRGAEQSLKLLVKLATFVGKGVRVWGFSVARMERPTALSVRDNSGQVFNIITSEEGDTDEAHQDEMTPAIAASPTYALSS